MVCSVQVKQSLSDNISLNTLILNVCAFQKDTLSTAEVFSESFE